MSRHQVVLKLIQIIITLYPHSYSIYIPAISPLILESSSSYIIYVIVSSIHIPVKYFNGIPMIPMFLGKLSYCTNLNLAAIKGDDFPNKNHDSQGSGDQWGRDQIYSDVSLQRLCDGSSSPRSKWRSNFQSPAAVATARRLRPWRVRENGRRVAAIRLPKNVAHDGWSFSGWNMGMIWVWWYQSDTELFFYQLRKRNCDFCDFTSCQSGLDHLNPTMRHFQVAF